MVIGLLAVFGALIPHSTGEKYGYLITVFLALIFYLDLMSSEIAPAGDKDLPLILYVLYATAASLTYSLIETIFWGKNKSSTPEPFSLRNPQMMPMSSTKYLRYF